MLDSYVNLEKLMGAPKERLLTLPEKDDDVEGWKAIHKRLGHPEKAEDYAFEVPAGGNEDFAKFMKGAFHELGLSKKQGDALAKKYGEHIGTLMANTETQANEKYDAEDKGLKAGWGQAYDQNVKIAARGQEKFGIRPEMLDRIESALGYKATMELMHSLGEKTGEAQFVNGDGGRGGFGKSTPEGARATIQSLMGDGGFQTLLGNGDSGAKAKWDELHQQAYPPVA